MVGGKSGKSPYDLTKKGSGIFVNKNFNADFNYGVKSFL